MIRWRKIRTPNAVEASVQPSKRDSLPQTAGSIVGRGPQALTAFPLDAEALKPHPLLSLIPSRLLDRWLSEPAFAEYPKGTVVFRAGEPCDAIFLILSGRCESRVKGSSGTSVVEEVFGPGDTLGERALLNYEAHRTTVTVVTHSVLLRLPSEEMRGLFAKDPSIAGRFAQTVTERVRRVRERDCGAPVRRIVSLCPISPRVDGEAVAKRLAASLRRITAQGVLLIHLSLGPQPASLMDWPKLDRKAQGEFRFKKHLRETGAGFFELALSTGGEPRGAGFIAPLLSHCGRHFEYVLLCVENDLPAAVSLETMIQSDLAFVLLQPSMQNLYDFQVLIASLNERTKGDCLHVKPVLFAEEHVAACEMHEALKQLGHPLHSFARGFPIAGQGGGVDRRFELHVNRLAREIARCRVGLALSSGGAKGLAHIGVIQVLEENGIEVDCIAGASMGAYVGAIWAYGLDGTVLARLAHELAGRWGIWSLLDPVLPPRQGFMGTSRITRRLRRSIGEAHFSDMIRPLRVVATHLDTLERIVFSSGDVAQTVAASIAIPGVCVPVTLDGETYIDGGIADPLPVDVIEEMGIERILAVNVIPPPERLRQWLEHERELSRRRGSQGLNLREAFGQHVNYFAHGNILDTMLQACNGAQTRVAEGASLHADVLLRPLACDASWHDFTNPGKYIALGRKAAEEQLPALKALVTSHESKLPTSSLALGSGNGAA